MAFLCNSILFIDAWRLFLSLLILLLFIIILTIIIENNFDIYLLYFLVLIGSLIIVCCDNLLIIYLGLELQSFSLFVLISKNTSSIKGSEAGLKYFMLGALSSGFYLLGLYLLFLFGLSLNIRNLIISLDVPITLLGLSLILLSFGFKLGLAPLHFWIPDIYEGSSWDVISLLSTLPKISIISIFIQFSINTNLVLFVSLLSVIVGTYGAINQTKLKRLLAYSSINHIGFIMITSCIINQVGSEIMLVYLFIYIVSVLSLFILITKTFFSKEYYIIELGGLQCGNKVISVTWLILFLSIAGIPPLSGFISKWFILWNIISLNYIYSSLILILFSIIGASYYLRVVKIIYFQKQSSYLGWEKILRVGIEKDNYNIFFLGLSVFFILFVIINLSPFLSFVNFLSF